MHHVPIPVWSGNGWTGPEPVEVRPLPNGRFVVLCPPRFAYGLAVGDEVELTPTVPAGFRVVRRSGNLTLWVYLLEPQAFSDFPLRAELPLMRIHAVLEGMPDKMAIITVPIASGWENIEGAMNGLVAMLPGAKWEYANAFDPTDGKPLNWWK